MLHTVLYPDFCSAPPWITLTPHALNLRSERLRGCCWNKLPLVFLACDDAPLPSATQLRLQGQCYLDSQWGKGTRASLTQQLWYILSGFFLHWAGLSSQYTPSSPCCCHSCLLQHISGRSSWRGVSGCHAKDKGPWWCVINHSSQQPAGCSFSSWSFNPNHSQIPGLRHNSEAAGFIYWNLQLPLFPLSLYFPSLQSSSALILYFDNHAFQPISHK